MPSVSISLSLEAFEILNSKPNKSAFVNSAILQAQNGEPERLIDLFSESEKADAVKEKVESLARQIVRGEKEKAVRNADLFSNALAKVQGVVISPNSLLNQAVKSLENRN